MEVTVAGSVSAEGHGLARPHLRWTSADGDRPLRGVVVWRGSGETDLATSIVDVNPGPVH